MDIGPDVEDAITEALEIVINSLEQADGFIDRGKVAVGRTMILGVMARLECIRIDIIEGELPNVT